MPTARTKARPARQAAPGPTIGTLTDLTPDPANRRTHSPRNLGMLVDALKVVGASRSIVVDETGMILAGNGVVEAASAAGLSKVQIVEADGETIIAVRRRGLTAAQKRQLAIYDNRTAELAEWNVDQLAADLQNGEDLTAFFLPDELASILGTGAKAGQTDPDAVPAVRATEIQRGDLFELGAHRLLCGDCTTATDVALVMNEQHAQLMNTDPPYGVNYDHQDAHDAKNDAYGETKQYRTFQKITGDELTGEYLQRFLETAIRVAVPHLVKNAAFYLWHPMLTQGTFFAAAAAAAADILIHRQIIWVKPHFIFGRGDYHWKHELCFYGWQRGFRPPFYGERNQDTVWLLAEGGGTIRKDQDHPTQKPVALFEPPILNHTRAAEWAYEPFAGSGSQLIACEQHARRCVALEIEPPYCQVILDRWEAFTGQRAVKVGEAIRA